MNENKKTITVNDYLANRVDVLSKVQDNLLWSECGAVTLAFALSGVFAQIFAVVSILLIAALTTNYVQFKIAEGRKGCVDAYMEQLASEEIVKGTVFIPALQTIGMDLAFMNEEETETVEFQREAVNNVCGVLTYKDGIEVWQKIVIDDMKKENIQTTKVSVL